MVSFARRSWLAVLPVALVALMTACSGTSPPASTVLTHRDIRAFEGRYANVSFDLLEPTLWSQLGGSGAQDKLTSLVDLRIEDSTLLVQLVEDGSIRAQRRVSCELRKGALFIGQAQPFAVRTRVTRVMGVRKSMLWQDADHALFISHDATGSLWVGAMPLTVAHTHTLSKGYMRESPLPP